MINITSITYLFVAEEFQQRERQMRVQVLANAGGQLKLSHGGASVFVRSVNYIFLGLFGNKTLCAQYTRCGLDVAKE